MTHMDTTEQTKESGAPHMAQSATQTMSGMKHKAQEWGSAMTEQAGTAAKAMGQSVSSLADTIQQKAPAEGMMGSAASTMAHQLEAAGSYLQDNGFDTMTRDLAGLIRRYPLQSLLLGFTVGYLWARNSER
jgi:hypothetical protein